jgi:hypothetical protein
MPLLQTAKNHFDEDIKRASDMTTHASPLPVSVVSDDIRRAAWMMAVGALDAFFSDAYADLVARTLRARDIQDEITIPSRLNNLKLPVTAFVNAVAPGWRWRMAARELIEEENVLSLNQIRGLFNQFFDDKRKLLNKATIGPWISHTQARQRVFGISRTAYAALPNPSKPKARETALVCMETHYEEIFQRRHDCIHNCDRPHTALQNITQISAKKTIEDVTFLVERCFDSLHTEFPLYLQTLGFNGVTRNKVLQ